MCFTNMFKTRITILFVFMCMMLIVCTGCESILTAEQMQKEYSGKNINEFVRERYVDQNKIVRERYLDNVVTLIGGNKQHETGINQYADRLLSDNRSVIYSAPFTSMNDKYLYKPRNELQLFCESQGGILFIKKKYNEYFDGLYQNPTVAYFEALNTDLPTGYTVADPVGFVLGSPATQEVKITDRDRQTIAALSAVGTIQQNAGPLAQTYVRAVNNNSFGVFVCRDNKTYKSKWGASVKPIAFSHADPNKQLITSSLYLLITPINN